MSEVKVHKLLPMLSSACAMRSRFAACERGATALIFAFALAGIVGAVGLAVDYGRATKARSELQIMLDSGVIAAVQESTQEGALAKLTKYVAAQSVNIPSLQGITASIISFNGSTLEATAESAIATTFTKILGQPSLSVKVSAIGQRARGYQEIYFAMDFSSSLGVAATQADRTALEALTKPYSDLAYGTALPQGCAFGCHRREGWEPGTKTVYQMARDAGIKLREDELLIQFGGLIDLLLNPAEQAVQDGLRKVSVMAFSTTARQLITPSNSASSVKAAMTTFPNYDRHETRFSSAFTELDRLLGTQGNGTAGNPEKTVILITDGIESREAFNSQSAISQDLCTAIRDKGFRLAIVEIKYPVLPSNFIYTDTVAPVEDSIGPGLQQCASPGWYFQAVNNNDVPAKFLQLKNQLLTSSTRLSR